jgi:hypothetical protein
VEGEQTGAGSVGHLTLDQANCGSNAFAQESYDRLLLLSFRSAAEESASFFPQTPRPKDLFPIRKLAAIDPCRLSLDAY